MPLRKMVLATDSSPEAAKAARMAITLSRDLGSELHVLCVGQVPSAYAPAESEILDYEFWKEMREFAKSEASERLEEEVQKIEAAGGKVEKPTWRWVVRTPRSFALPRRSGLRWWSWVAGASGH